MNRSYPLLLRFGVFVILPVVALAAYLFWYLNASLAQTSGRVVISGLQARTEVRRDELGVVRIHAKKDRDVYVSMGYVQAQDRMWQLEFQRRLAQGRLSEVFGKTFVERDAYVRTLGLYDASQSAWDALSPEARDSLEAYAEGVNAWLAEGHTLPAEFTLLGISPAPWRPVDSLAWIKFFAFTLSSGFNREVERFLAKSALNDEQYKAIYPPGTGPSNGDVPKIPDARASQMMSELSGIQTALRSTLRIGMVQSGSNAWAVSGRHTASGQALMANDPHLGLQMPSAWYVVDLSGEKLKSSGMSLVGLPLVLFGANQHIAWGGTNMMADVQDGYLEQLDPQNPKRYLRDGHWHDLEIRQELIRVRTDFPQWLRPALKPVHVQVRTTAHGPILSDVTGYLEQAISLRWTALDKGDTTYESIYRINLASDWATFRAASSLFVAPPLNLLYSDDRGNIGYQGVGRIPIRTRGGGDLPVPGWSNDYRWRGYIPFDEMPHAYNPEKGYIVSANTDMSPSGYKHFISKDWAPPHRATRIEALLAAAISTRSPITVESTRAMQLDVLSLQAKEMLPVLLALAPSNALQTRALSQLSAWDGAMTRESSAASIYMAWMRHLRKQLFTESLAKNWSVQARGSALSTFGSEVGVEVMVAALTDGRGVWCAPQSDEKRSCRTVLRQSLADALQDLRKRNGNDVEDWALGRLHFAHYRHVPFSESGLLKHFFERKVSTEGADDTVNVGGPSYVTAGNYLHDIGPVFRQVVEFSGSGPRQFFSGTGGQSGNFFSAHYDDMQSLFDRGALSEIDRSGKQGASTLILDPT